MAKKSGGRLISSAGLVTYYDSEDRRSLHIRPEFVLVIAAVIGIATFAFNVFF
ncbi:MAG: preprotein translocase subunit Sec61beta [Methanomicrobiales archaeon]|nr:preprotein translocase subunit Sec61beta [Methanomicrobiales archaeon]